MILLTIQYEALIFAVGLSGIGGKRSSGCGRFTPEFCEVPGYLLEKLENDSGSAVSLSVCLPKNDEIESIIDDASYSLIKKAASYILKHIPIHRIKRMIFMFSEQVHVLENVLPAMFMIFRVTESTKYTAMPYRCSCQWEVSHEKILYSYSKDFGSCTYCIG